MMDDLISREKAIERIKKQCEHLRPESDSRDSIGWFAYHICIGILEVLPTARKTGKWIVHTEIENVYGGIYIECSECGESYVVQHLDAEIFCRTCGSKNGV